MIPGLRALGRKLRGLLGFAAAQAVAGPGPDRPRRAVASRAAGASGPLNLGSIGVRIASRCRNGRERWKIERRIRGRGRKR
jgi:hypothetical protein